MILMLTGSHGSGKTTLAEKLSEKLDIPFFKSHASAIHEALGVNAADDIPMKKRLEVQEAILGAWIKQHQAALMYGSGIFDRTPLDFAAYTLADVRRSSDTMDANLAESYVRHCLDLAANLPNILLVEPLSVNLGDRGTGKASAANTAYSYLIHALISGFLLDRKIRHNLVPAISLEGRVSLLARIMSKKFDLRAEAIAKPPAASATGIN